MIGTLTLMITGLALTGMGKGRNDESVLRAEEFVALQKQTSDDKKKLDGLSAALQQAGSLNAKVVALQELLKARDAAAAMAKRERLLQGNLKSLLPRVSAFATELARVKRGLDALRQELATRQQSLLKDQVRVLPPKGASTTRFKPYFVEAGKNGLTVYHGAKPYTIKTSDIRKNKQLNDLLAKLAGEPSAQLVILVRNNGIASMGILSSQAEKKGVNVGKLPLVGMGRVDLSGM